MFLPKFYQFFHDFIWIYPQLVATARMSGNLEKGRKVFAGLFG